MFMWFEMLLKKAHAAAAAFPVLLSIFILLTWLSLRLQNHSNSNSSIITYHQNSHNDNNHQSSGANLVKFSSSQISKDHRGWILNPISLALDQHIISGGAVTCASVHVGEIKAAGGGGGGGGGGFRGNHRHHTCNETFVIWGAKTIFRLEKSSDMKGGGGGGGGYAQVVIGADEVAVAASPAGTAHALVNMDPVRTTYFMACQDAIIDYNSSTTDFNVWNDLL